MDPAGGAIGLRQVVNPGLLFNSLLLATVTTALALAFGVLAALGVRTLGRLWSRVFLGVAAAVLALPPFLTVNCWLDLLGPDGFLRPLWFGNLASIAGAAWILSLWLWPVTCFLVLAALARLEADWLEADPALTGWRLARHLLWPLARAASGWAAFITLVLSLNQFTVPALLQVRVLAAAVWVDFSVRFDAWAALRTAWPLVAAPWVLLVALGWRRRALVEWPRAGRPVSPDILRRQLGPAWAGAGRLTAAGLGLVALAVPLGHLVLSAETWLELGTVVRAVPGSIVRSFLFAAGAALGGLVLGWITWPWRWPGFLWLMFLVPGTLMGIGCIVVLNRPAFEWISSSAVVVVLVWVARYGVLGWMGVRWAMRQADRDLVDAARLQGASGWRLLRHVQWPQAAGPSLAAAYVVYVLCLWDVETLILIAPPGGETLALRVFNLLHYGHNAQVNALCVLLLALAIAPGAAGCAAAWIRSRRATHEA